MWLGFLEHSIILPNAHEGRTEGTERVLLPLGWKTPEAGGCKCTKMEQGGDTSNWLLVRGRSQYWAALAPGASPPVPRVPASPPGWHQMLMAQAGSHTQAQSRSESHQTAAPCMPHSQMLLIVSGLQALTGTPLSQRARDSLGSRADKHQARPLASWSQEGQQQTISRVALAQLVPPRAPERTT